MKEIKFFIVQTDNIEHSHQGTPRTELHILKFHGPKSEMDLLEGRGWGWIHLSIK